MELGLKLSVLFSVMNFPKRFVDQERGEGQEGIISIMCSNYNLLMRALEDQEVKFLIAGGTAVKFYCPEREVDDLDLLINSTEENAIKVQLAFRYLHEKGFNFLGIGLVEGKIFNKLDKIAKPAQVFSLKKMGWVTKTINADILTSPVGFDFNSAFDSSIVEKTYGVHAHIISCCDLIRYKHTPLEKDREDIKLLKQVCADCD